jgi:hypothetical protein
MLDLSKLRSMLPARVQRRVELLVEAASVMREVQDPRVMISLGPSAVRGLVLQRGKQGTPTKTPSHHAVHFDWKYPSDKPEMRALYTKAKKRQWNAEVEIDWTTDVDPLDPARRVLPEDFIDFEGLERMGFKLDARERMKLSADLAAWLLSQFLHGEQGALFAAAQVTEAVQFFDGKLYGSTQVMDEGRHVEVFHKYISEKLGKLYEINDNLFVIIDGLMSDPRWDMKFLGMQIMVEGLALGAFGTIYKDASEPLLKDILRLVIQDEARHVHYGILALRDHIAELSDSERREREDWTFEVALLMSNRLIAHEIFDEWFAGRMKRSDWVTFVRGTPGMYRFRKTMFTRLVPNLREIGLVTPRMMPRYEKVGLLEYMGGLATDRIDGLAMIAELDRAA